MAKPKSTYLWVLFKANNSIFNADFPIKNGSQENVNIIERNTNQKQLTRRRKSFTKRENVEKSLTKHEILFLRFAMICIEQVSCQAKDYNPNLKKVI